MKEKTNISVIIPCYNVEKTIAETLTSLSMQSKLPLEVICVDDGSPDNTNRVIKEFAEKSDLNIILERQINQGVSVARNKGISLSKGKIILFLDGDDKYSPWVMDAVEASFYEDCDCSYFYFKREEALLSKDYSIEINSKATVMQEFMVKKNKCHTSAYAYLRDIILSNNLMFTVGLRYGEDWEFTTKYLDCCNLFKKINAYGMFYRININSAMNHITYSHTDSILAAVHANEFLSFRSSCFQSVFYPYMKSKALFSVAHNFAKAKRIDLYNQLFEEYEVKKMASILIKSKYSDLKTKLGCFVLVISRKMFYMAVGRL